MTNPPSTSTPGPRYIVRTSTASFRQHSGIWPPHEVIDTMTGTILDEYHSKRAAQMHARDLNHAEKPETR